MRVETIRALPEFAPIRPHVTEESRVAVLLNANARRVNSHVERVLQHVVPQSDLYVSHSLEEARSIARWVVDQRYRTVFSGGGDGTFVTWMNLILDLVDQHRAAPGRPPLRYPRFGVLRLGTGNGLADWVGASSVKNDGILDDVLRARAGEVSRTRTLDLLSVEGRRAQFAGAGLDGMILNDYLWVKDNLGHGALKALTSGGMGYFLAVAARSLPREIFRGLARVEVVNQGTARRIDSGGKAVGPLLGPGEVLFRGTARVVAGSTIPYYGYKFMLFPFAGRRRSMMHLRIAACSVPTVLANLGKIWKGKFAHPEVLDFFADNVRINFESEMPVQIGGDGAGYRRSLHLEMAPRAVEMIDFTAAP